MRGRHQSYRLPALDSARAVSNATLFLAGARALDGVTAQSLAHQYRLSPKRAEYMLTMALQRRREQ